MPRRSESTPARLAGCTLLMVLWCIFILLEEASCEADAASSAAAAAGGGGDKSTRSANNNNKGGRGRGKSAPWRLMFCLTQAHAPLKSEVQKAWEEARLESPQAELDVSYVEARVTPVTDSLSYSLLLLNRFCADVEKGKTILNIVVGGGPPARFLVTAANSLNLPTLWLPFTHKDFLRQVYTIYA